MQLTVLVLVDVEDGKDLSVVGDHGLSHHLSRHHQMLEDLQCGADDSGVPGVEGICRVGNERSGDLPGYAYIVLSHYIGFYSEIYGCI